MKKNYFFIVLTCGILFTNTGNILSQSLENGESPGKNLIKIEQTQNLVVDLVDNIRSSTPFQIIRLARYVNKGELSPRILTAIALIKTLSPEQLDMIRTRGNMNQLPKKLLNNLNYLVFLNDADKQRINEIINKNYLSNFDLTKERVPRYDDFFKPEENNFLKLVNLFYQMNSNKLETILILQDMEILPVKVLEHIKVIKSIDQNEFFQMIHKIKPLPDLLEKTLSEMQKYDLDQVNLILKFVNLNSQQIHFLYSLAFLNIIPPEQLNIIIKQFNLENSIKNIIDLLVKFKLLPKEVVNNIKEFSQTGIVSVIILNVFDHLEKLSLIEINQLIYDLGLGVHLSKYLPPFLSSKIQNIVSMLRNLDSKKLFKLSMFAKDGLMPNYLVTAASISASLSSYQMENIAKQKNLNQLPVYVLEMLEYFRKLPSSEYKLISSLAHANINNLLNSNKTYSKTWTKNEKFLSKINGCFESKTVTIVTTKTFNPVDESQKCAANF